MVVVVAVGVESRGGWTGNVGNDRGPGAPGPAEYVDNILFPSKTLEYKTKTLHLQEMLPQDSNFP
jgi:hypothetical protein